MAASGRPSIKGHAHIRNPVTASTFVSWKSMMSRCNSPTSDRAHWYHDRGVTVCERWSVFENFLADMGLRPEGTTLDRWPDMDGNYEPSNCRWATPREQSRNRKTCRLTLEIAIEIAVLRLRGETSPSIAAKFGISRSLASAIGTGDRWPEALEAAKKIIGENHE